MEDNKYRWIYQIEIVIYILTLIICSYLNYQSNYQYGIKMGFVAIFTPFIIPLFFKLLKWQMTYRVRIVNITFMYFASLIGSSYYGYSIPLFDKLMHFISGILTTIFAILLFCKIKQSKKITNESDYQIFLIFINALNLAIAVLWEFYEYLMLIFFNNDCIHHYSSGVHDSLTDMMCAFVAGLLITIMIIRYYRNGKSNFLISMYEEMYDLNLDEKAGYNYGSKY